MKQVGFIALGVVVGFLLGGIGPRREVKERERQISELQEELASGRGSRFRPTLPGFDRILRRPDDKRGGSSRDDGRDGEARPEPSIEAAPAEGGEQSLRPAPMADGGVPRRSWRERWRNRRFRADALDEFELAADAQMVRAAQSRAALIEQAGLDDDQVEALDAAIKEMNDALYGHGEEILDIVMREEPPEPREMLGVAHDVTGILHDGQTAIEAAIGADRVQDVDPKALEIWNHVDLAQLERAAREAARRQRR